MNKVCCLNFMLTTLLLCSCVASTSKTLINEQLINDYNELTTGEKSIKKAFKVYELIGDCWRKNHCIDYYPEYNRVSYGRCHPGQQLEDTDFVQRFIVSPYYYYYDRDLGNAASVQVFDKNSGLSDKEKHCLSLTKKEYDKYEFINNEDECILIRRHLLTETNLLEQCVFDYHDYIPENAKIDNMQNFKSLYNAYTESIADCNRKRENNSITTTEYYECINKTEAKMEKIATSGVLQ